MTNAETEVASYFAKYEPGIAKLGKALRAKLRARLPGIFEVVYYYANQESLVISFSPTEQGYEATYSLALYPDCVKLFFGQGAVLAKSDPNKLLKGSGKLVRFVAMDSADDFDRADVQDLMDRAAKLSNLRLDPSAKGSVIVKADEQKARASRAKKAASKAPAAGRRKPGAKK